MCVCVGAYVATLNVCMCVCVCVCVSVCMCVCVGADVATLNQSSYSEAMGWSRGYVYRRHDSRHIGDVTLYIQLYYILHIQKLLAGHAGMCDMMSAMYI